jgi:hypothetical protein
VRSPLWLLAVLVAVLALGGCGGADKGPRKYQVASLGKDSTGDEIDPEELAAKGDTLWLTLGAQIGRVDGKEGKLIGKPQDVGHFRLPALIYDIAAGDAGVWAVLGGDDGRVYLVKVDERTGRPGEPIRIKLDATFVQAGDGFEVAVGNGRVYAALTGSNAVVSLDPASGRQQQIDAGGPVQDVGAGAGSGWVLTKEGDDLSDSPYSSAQLVRIGDEGVKGAADLDSDPTDIAVHGNDVWVLTGDGAELHRPDGEKTADVDLDDADTAGVGWIVAGDDSIWVQAYGDQKLIRIDSKTRKVSGRPFKTPEEVRDVAIAGGYLWTTSNYDAPRRVRE